MMRGRILKKLIHHVHRAVREYHFSRTRLPKGLVGLITGVDEGLGRAATERFFNDHGAKLVLLSYKKEDTVILTGLQKEEDYLSLEADIRSDEDLKPVFEEAKQKFGRLDFVIHTMETADAHPIYNTVKQRKMDVDLQYNELFLFNTNGAFNICRLAAELMSQNEPDEEGQRGCIITTSHICAMDGMSATSMYAASKNAINSMTLPMSRDLASLGIRVNTIQMGMMDIELHNTIGQIREKPYIVYATPFPKKFGDPEEYVDLCESILSNRYLNGEIIQQDGAFRFPTFRRFTSLS